MNTYSARNPSIGAHPPRHRRNHHSLRRAAGDPGARRRSTGRQPARLLACHPHTELAGCMDGSAANPRPALTEGPESLQRGPEPAPEGERTVPRSLDEFLAGVERRAFRVAELALGHREDAL